MNEADFQAIEQAIAIAISHIIANGCDDIFKPPTFSHSIESEVIKKNPDEFRKRARSGAIEFLKNCDLSKSKIGNIHHSLVVKDQFTFRKVSWIDPFDLVKYLSAAILLFDKIEEHRVPAHDEVVHSHRRHLSGNLFDESFGYVSFRKRSGELSRASKGKWKVVTDIANFFDRIGNHPLENHLLNCGCDIRYVTLIREILYFWAGDRRSFGVPIGSDASRILCEAALINVDRKLTEGQVRYLRYVDDIRIFANTRAEAYKAVQLLTTLLAEEGLSLNSKKTQIYEIVGDDEAGGDPNVTGHASHNIINLDEKIPQFKSVVVSGRTTMARYYKKPGDDALRLLRRTNKDEIINEILSSSDEEFEELIRKTVKFFFYVNPDLELLRTLLRARVTSVFYIVDAAVKEYDRLTDDMRAAVRDLIIEEVDPVSAAYPLQIPVLRLCGSKGYEDGRIINTLIDSHRLGDNLLFLREAVSLNFAQLDRARVRTLALEHFRNVPDFVRRAIFIAVRDAPQLSDDERRPLIKNMLQATDDWFVLKLKH